MKQQLRPALMMLVLFTILTGILYPAAVTLIAHMVFPGKANGSIITNNGTEIGSAVIGQDFSSPKYFWSRLSATSPFPYNAGASTGSNYGPGNPALLDAVHNRIAQLRYADSSAAAPIPVDLVTASASGLDPDISIAAALYQLPRVAAARNVPQDLIKQAVNRVARQRIAGFFGEPRVNVLKLNLALDELPSQGVK